MKLGELFEAQDADARVHDYVEGLARSAHSNVAKEWLRQHVPQAVEDWGVNNFFRDAAPHTRDFTAAIGILDRVRPNNIDDLDLRGVMRLAIPLYVEDLVPLATHPKVVEWVRTVIPAYIDGIGALQFFTNDEDRRAGWQKTFDAAIRFLNDNPPGSPNAPLSEIIAAMKDPKRVAKGHKLGRKDAESPAFRSWFGNSKVVDHLGHPLVVFRGTRRPGSGSNTAYDTKLNTTSFAASPEIASVYASDTTDMIGTPSYKGGAMVGAYYLSIQKPIVFDDITTTLADAVDKLLPDAYPSDDASLTRITGILSNLQEMEDSGRPIQIKLPKRSYFRMDWEDLDARLAELSENGDGEAINDLLAEIEVDAYALADCEEFIGWAMVKGFDGIIHPDVFGERGQTVALSLLGKSPADFHAVDFDGDADVTHITFRPFSQSQIKSVWNSGRFDPKSDHVNEGRWVPSTPPKPHERL
jgi:hypothetical protein